MKVILLEDVKSLGKKGDVVKVSDGYASNFILPKKLGVEATQGNLNSLKVQQKREAKEAAETLAQAQAFREQIERKTIRVMMRAGEGGKAFGSVSSKEIAAAAKEQYGFEIDRKKIQVAEPIKSFGEFELPVKLHPQVTATIRVSVVEE